MPKSARCLCGECNICRKRKSDHEYYIRNKERIKNHVRKRYNENRERNLEWFAAYREEKRNDPEWCAKQRESKAKWAEENDYERTRRDRKKRRARRLFQQAVKFGRIERQPCSVCGKPNAEGHHEDYEKPYEVLWFCRKHHAEHERDQKRCA